MVEMLQLQRAVAEDAPLSTVPTTASSAVTEAFKPSSSIQWATSLWFISLTLSLATALIALLARQWLHSYAAQTSGSARKRGQIRHLRFTGLIDWNVLRIIATLPIVLHLSLALFFVGLVIYLVSLNLPVVYVVAVIVCVTFAAYFVATILPLVYPRCPYRTPLTLFAYKFICAVRMALRTSLSSPPKCLDGDVDAIDLPYIDICGGSVDAETISWLYASTSNWTVKSICMEAVAGLPLTYSYPLDVSDTMIAEICSEAISMSRLLDAEAEMDLEALLRGYIQLMHRFPGREWQESPLAYALSDVCRQGIRNPQLDAALCALGSYSPIDVTRKLIDVAIGPARTALRLHPLIWMKQLSNAHASCDSTSDFVLATEIVKILVSVDYFSYRDEVRLVQSDVTSTSISQPTLEMADAMFDYLLRSSPSLSAQIKTSEAERSCALLGYLQCASRHLGGNTRSRVDLEVIRDTLQTLRYTMMHDSKASQSLSIALHSAYRDSLFAIATSPYFAKSAVGAARQLLGDVLSEIQAVLSDTSPSRLSLPAFWQDDERDCYDVTYNQHLRNRSLGMNLLGYVLSYNVGGSSETEQGAWAICHELFERGAPFIFDVFIEENGLIGLFNLFHSTSQGDASTLR